MNSYLEKEIYEQLGILKRIASEKIDFYMEKSVSRVIFVASGSSKNVSDFGAYFFEQIAKIPAKVEYASELLGKSLNFNQDDLVIFVSQSGKSADVLKVFNEVKVRPCKKMALVNDENSPMALNSDYVLYMDAGKEYAIPATKTFSATYLKLYLLAKSFAGQEISKGEVESIINSVDFILQGKFSTILAEKLLKAENVIIIGSNLARFSANEVSLKLQETAFINAFAYPAGEFMHGHMAVLKNIKNLIAISFEQDSNHKTNLNNIQKIKNTYNPDITIITDDCSCVGALIIPKTDKFLLPILTIILFQITCLKLALLKGIDPDLPEGLKKIVE